jgi:outer membrane protein
MNKTLQLAKITLLTSVVALFFVQCKGKQADKTDEASMDATALKGKLPIAVINIDTLLDQYQFAKDVHEELAKAEEDLRVQINERIRKVQADEANFASKVKNNAFLSRERAESENNRLLNQRSELEKYGQQLKDNFQEKQIKLNEQLNDTVNKFLKKFAPQNHYQLIISTTTMGNVPYCSESYDITKEVIQQLNARYKKK